MPLIDVSSHPYFDTWKSFNANWAVKMVDRLNGSVLSDEYRATQESAATPPLEIDVATLELLSPAAYDPATNGSTGGVAVAPAAVYAPPAVDHSVEVELPTTGLYEVLVSDRYRQLVAAIELVSTSNKDRPQTRHQFAVKLASYLQAGVSVVVIDLVTERAANLHAELCDLLDVTDGFGWESPSGLSAISYQLLRRKKKADAGRLDGWFRPLAIGQELPILPLWLGVDLAVPLELELTFVAACQSQRIR